MKILIATPIYFPDIGGPALYAKELAEGFRGAGHSVSVEVFNRNLPSGLRHLAFMVKGAASVAKSDVIIALDHFSVGLPAVLLSIMFSKSFYVRVGGDFLWEQWIERTRSEVSLPDFYKKDHKLSFKERIIFYIAQFVFRHSRLIIFTTEWQREIFLNLYGISPDKTAVVENYFPEKQKTMGDPDKEFVWAGRKIFLKNVERLVRAFVRFHNKNTDGYTLRLVGSGPLEEEIRMLIVSLGAESYISLEEKMSKEKLRAEIAQARSIILPSFSEISPNTLAESLCYGVPGIVTKFFGWPPKQGIEKACILVDPFKEDSILAALEDMADEEKYKEYKKGALRYQCDRPTEKLINDYMFLFKNNEERY